MKLFTRVLFKAILLFFTVNRFSYAGICPQAYTCSSTCYRQQSYTTKCGLFNWSRCNRYRSVSTPCTKTCYRRFCCSGFTGGDCSTHINECDTNKGGCEQNCANDQGSFHCWCKSGYKLNLDGITCSDVDECVDNKSNCHHGCINTIGSYTCECRTGYELELDGFSCSDIDECTQAVADCQHTCSNNIGSFTCSCLPGYSLLTDGKACQDINECVVDNGNCQQLCINEPGSYSCSCHAGYRQNADGNTCTDMDECVELTSGCTQLCINKIGSFSCVCNYGYELGNDGKTCFDIDDCIGVNCHNGGTCVDGLASFKCLCYQGFTGDLCQSDVNECSFLNGGCQDTCLNMNGTFECSCIANRILNDDGLSCQGQSSSDSVFRRHNIARQLLPRGCYTIMLTKCTDGEDIEVYMSSTTQWFKLISDNRIIYTFGLVFVEVNSLSLPVSLNGVEIDTKKGSFIITLGANTWTINNGEAITTNIRTTDCIAYELTASDIFDFISSNSFLKSVFDSLLSALPDWAQFTSIDTSVLNVADIKTDLVYGNDMDDTTWCDGAPVIPEHLYSVFRFGSNFSLRVYGQDVNIPKPLNGRKFCLIVDICHNYGGTVVLMLPEASEDALLALNVFRNLYHNQQLLIKLRGIGISVVKGINVHYAQRELQLWNGDHIFRYPVFERADVWIGGGVVRNSSNVLVEGDAEVFISIPRPDRLLTAVFIDEWNSLIKIKMSAAPTLKFKVFGSRYSITFTDMVTGSIDMYMSVGGIIPRQWCGEVSNPPGVFLSALITVNPFPNVPILKDWVFDTTITMYAFVTTDPASQITAYMKVDVVNDVIQLDGMIKRLQLLLNDTFTRFKQLLSIARREILLKLEESLDDMIDLIKTNMNNIIQGEISGLSAILPELWKQFTEIRDIFTDFLDFTEHSVDGVKDNFISLIRGELENIKHNIHETIQKFTNQVSSSIEDFDGMGVKLRATIVLFGLRLLDIDIEIVYSTESLLKCSRFDEVKKLLEGEQALRVLGRVSREIKLGYFLRAESGFGLGAAFGIDSTRVILHMNAYISMLGISVTGDVFISRNRLYFYIEANIWNIFLAQVDVSATVGQEWYQLTFNLTGVFMAKARKKRQTQAVSSSFQSSYLDALKKVTHVIADEAKKRLSQVQSALSDAQNGLSRAQDWLEDKKTAVRKSNEAFDKAIAVLEKAKQKLDEAKGPFERAIAKLESAQRKVDNLCRIRECGKICIPRLRCKWCKTGGWIKIPYPCCTWTSCMISFPDPICLLANLLCRAIRVLAYAALELAKIFVRIPMIAFDIAKAALSVAQFIVDKSRVVLDIAAGLLDLAKLALEGAKGVLETAKFALEVVKIAIGAAVKVLDFVIEYGLKNILDVRNCGFNIEMSTRYDDLPVFDVFCEVNAFKLGWKKVTMRINFKNILQTIWQAAKATIKAITSVFSGRRKREITFEASTRVHSLLRKIRQAQIDSTSFTNDTINEIINVVDSTDGFNASLKTDYDNRVALFERKCKTITRIMTFMEETSNNLIDIANLTKTNIDDAKYLRNQLVDYNTEEMVNNITLENAEISAEYALRDYNLTQSDLDKALEDSKTSFTQDPLLLELHASTQQAKEQINEEIESVQLVQLLNHWILAMENITNGYFDRSECANFRDCVFYSISHLYDLYEDEQVPNVIEIKQAIPRIEDVYLNILNNQSESVDNVYDASQSIVSNLQVLSDTNIFCAIAPRFVTSLRNQNVLEGKTATIHCLVVGDHPLQYWWYKNGEMLEEEHGNVLVIENVSGDDEAEYYCAAGNVVANITSNEAHIFVWESEENGGSLEFQCVKENCNVTSLCYIVHPTSCIKFVMCQTFENGTIVAQVMSCAFGMMWKPGMESKCERTESVDCQNDPCGNHTINKYDHEDGNCKTYYRCVNDHSVPDCCGPNKGFDYAAGKCVKESTCVEVCPLLEESSCKKKGGVNAVSYPDGNCKTHWDCRSGLPHPVCCADDQGYNITQAKCISNQSCVDACPEEYKDICAKRGVTSYDDMDGNCRTYIRCNTLGLDDGYCCPSGRMFDEELKECVYATSDDCAEIDCPDDYFEVCRLKAVPDEPYFYTDLDDYSNNKMPCAEGTIFFQADCGCVHDREPVTTGCRLMAVPGEPHYYTDTDDWGNNKMPCAAGTIFSQAECVCVHDNQPATVCRLKAVPDEPYFYTDLDDYSKNKMPCAEGTIFLQSDCGCVHDREPVTTGCRLMAVPGEPHYYTDIDDWGNNKMPCAAGTIFSQAKCVCVHDNQPATVCRLKAVQDEPYLYTDLDDYSKNKMPCAEGTIFLQSDCGCVHDREPVTTGCRLMAVPGEPHYYTDTDDWGNNKMPCAAGTIFSQAECVCVHDNQPATVCRLKAVPDEPYFYTDLDDYSKNKMPCAEGTIFLQSDCVCVHDREPVTTGCRLMAVPGEPHYYTDTDDWGNNKMPCAAGTIFSQAECGCVHDNQPAIVCRLKAVPDEPYFYTDLDDYSNNKMPCAEGTIFLQSDCGCVHDREPVTTGCRLMAVPAEPHYYTDTDDWGNNKMTCAAGTIFSQAECVCVHDNQPATVCRLKAVPDEPYFYTDLDDYSKNKMPCAEGTIFLQLDCGCVHDREPVTTGCRLMAVPGEPHYYTDIDDWGNNKMPCSAGTIFSQAECGCVHDNQPATGCRLKAIPGQPNVYRNHDDPGNNDMPCPSGTVFDQKQCGCVLDNEPETTGCRLKAIPGEANIYRNLDDPGNNQMPCPSGTVFDQDQCGCVLANLPDRTA